MSDKRIVGVLGGGQLGRMMGEAANRLGIQLIPLDPGGGERAVLYFVAFSGGGVGERSLSLVGLSLW